MKFALKFLAAVIFVSGGAVFSYPQNSTIYLPGAPNSPVRFVGRAEVYYFE